MIRLTFLFWPNISYGNFTFYSSVFDVLQVYTPFSVHFSRVRISAWERSPEKRFFYKSLIQCGILASSVDVVEELLLIRNNQSRNKSCDLWQTLESCLFQDRKRCLFPF